MNKYAAIFVNDMKNTRRDPTYLVILIIPVLLILVTQFALPAVAEKWPIIIDYYPLIISFFCVLTSVMPGFIVSFMLLDERDQHVITAIRTMPVRPSGFFGMRMLFMFFFGWLGSFLLLLFNGILIIPLIKSIIISTVCALSSPFFVFLTISLAKNKIEGATIMKVLNILIMLPMVSFFIDHPLVYAFGIIPFFWIYEGFLHIDNTTPFIIYFTIGMLVSMLFNYVFYRIALRKYYYK